MKIELILLAGGDSKRFAAKSNESGGKKLLAPFKDKPLFEYALKAAEAFKPFGKVTVVTGEESIRLAAQEKGFRIISRRLLRKESRKGWPKESSGRKTACW